MVWNLPAIGVSVIVNMTDLRGLLMKQCTTRKESGKQMMSQNLNQKMSPMQTSGVSDSHARKTAGTCRRAKWDILQHY